MPPTKHSEPPPKFLLGTYELTERNEVILETEKDSESSPLSGSESPESRIAVTEFTERIEDGKPIAMSMQQPRLTANGKRVGRPPGTFRNPAVLMKSGQPIPKKQKLSKAVYNPAKMDQFIETCQESGIIKKTPKKSYPKIKPFKCRMEPCEKTFKSAADLEKHENRTHSNKRHCVCEIPECNKAYTDPSSLRKHILHVHGRDALENRKKLRTPTGNTPQPINNFTPVHAIRSPSEEYQGPTADSFTPNSAFTMAIPVGIKTILGLVSILNLEQHKILTSEILSRQEFVVASHRDLSRPYVFSSEYNPCTCPNCEMRPYLIQYFLDNNIAV